MLLLWPLAPTRTDGLKCRRGKYATRIGASPLMCLPTKQPVKAKPSPVREAYRVAAIIEMPTVSTVVYDAAAWSNVESNEKRLVIRIHATIYCCVKRRRFEFFIIRVLQETQRRTTYTYLSPRCIVVLVAILRSRGGECGGIIPPDTRHDARARFFFS